MEIGGQRQAPAVSPLGKGPVTHCVGDWMGSTAGLGGRGKSHPHRDWIPGPSNP